MVRKQYKFLALVMALVLTSTGVMAGAAANTAPIAKNLELTTFCGVSAGGRLNAVDPEGDRVSYEITTSPNKGKLELSEDGHFIYTPTDGKKGKDYFGYKAIDSAGNRSQEATVIIQLVKQKTSVSYTDTSGLSCNYAAHALAEAGVLVGQSIGGKYVFEPNRAVSRGEFLSMCMNITKMNTLSGVKSTGFADDACIPTWVKPYVSTALLSGMIEGYTAKDGAIFNADAAISYSEAAVMLSRVMHATNVANIAPYVKDNVPSWASQAVANMEACNIMDTSVSAFSSGLTRAEAAQMLVRAMSMLRK